MLFNITAYTLMSVSIAEKCKLFVSGIVTIFTNIETWRYRIYADSLFI